MISTYSFLSARLCYGQRNRCRDSVHCLLTFRQFDKKVLRVECRHAGGRLHIPFSTLRFPGTHISAIFLQDTRLHIVRQISSQNLLPHPLTEEHVFQREHYFDALVKVARHPVGTAQIHFFLSSISEEKNTAVLQEAAYDAAHPDVIADAADSRTQGAHAAN